MKHTTEYTDHVHNHILLNVSNMSINMEQSPSLIKTNTNGRKRQYSMNTHYTKQQTQHNTNNNIKINGYYPPSCKRQKLSSTKPYISSFKSSNNYYNKRINNNTCINSTNTSQTIQYNNVNNNETVSITSDRNENSHTQSITAELSDKILEYYHRHTTENIPIPHFKPMNNININNKINNKIFPIPINFKYNYYITARQNKEDKTKPINNLETWGDFFGLVKEQTNKFNNKYISELNIEPIENKGRECQKQIKEENKLLHKNVNKLIMKPEPILARTIAIDKYPTTYK